MRTRPRRPEPVLRPIWNRRSPRRDERGQRPLLADPRGEARSLLARLEIPQADLVARLTVGGSRRDQIRVEPGGSKRLPDALGLITVLERAHLHRPVAGPHVAPTCGGR